MKELRLQSGQPEADFRLAVAVDAVNALWGRSTIKKEDRTAVRETHPSVCIIFCFSQTGTLMHLCGFPQVDPEELTLVYNLRKLMKNNWVREIQGLTPRKAALKKQKQKKSLVTFTVLSQSGGAIITTLSQTGALYRPKSAYMPQELLGEVGEYSVTS